MTESIITLTKQQQLWLKDLILSDIHDWQSMAARPVDEVGVLFAHLADTRINSMRILLAKLDTLESAKTPHILYQSFLRAQ